MSAFQSTIRYDQGFGVIGEPDLTGPHRMEPGIINSPDATQNVIGRIFTQNSSGYWRAGDPDQTAERTAFLCNPKNYALQGDGVAVLNPSMTLPNQANGEFMTMGFVTIGLPGAIDPGARLVYAQATGIVSAIANGASVPAGSALVPNGYVDRYAAVTGGLVVRARITN